MRFVLSLILCAGILVAIGCGGDGKKPIKEATDEDKQQQKEAEDRAKAEESGRRKTQPKGKTHEQEVEGQERNRRR
jgi:hypothetical protein